MGKYYDPQRDKPRKFQEYYWYITGTCRKTGKVLFAGRFNTEDEAVSEGFRLFDGAFERYKLPTADANEAKRMIRWKEFKESGGDDSKIRPFFRAKGTNG